MSCPTCSLPRSQPKDERLKQTLHDAKKQAIEHFETKTVCRDTGGNYFICAYSFAIDNYLSIIEVVSKYP